MSYATLIRHTRVYQEARQEGREEGRKEEAADVIGRQLKKRFGQDLSEETRARIQSLSLPVLQKLTVDLLDFSSLADLQPWLEAQ